MAKIFNTLMVFLILLPFMSCDRLSPKPVNYHVYVLDKYCDTVEYNVTRFVYTGHGSVPIRRHGTKHEYHIKFQFWNIKESTPALGDIIFDETTSWPYYQALQKGQTYIFNERDEYELGLRSKEKYCKFNSK